MPHIEFDTIASARAFYCNRRQGLPPLAAARLARARVTLPSFADCQFGSLQ